MRLFNYKFTIRPFEIVLDSKSGKTQFYSGYITNAQAEDIAANSSHPFPVQERSRTRSCIPL